MVVWCFFCEVPKINRRSLSFNLVNAFKSKKGPRPCGGGIIQYTTNKTIKAPNRTFANMDTQVEVYSFVIYNFVHNQYVIFCFMQIRYLLQISIVNVIIALLILLFFIEVTHNASSRFMTSLSVGSDFVEANYECQFILRFKKF